MYQQTDTHLLLFFRYYVVYLTHVLAKYLQIIFSVWYSGTGCDEVEELNKSHQDDEGKGEVS